MSIKKIISNVASVIRQGFGTLIKDPQITIYAYLALGFIYITSPIVTRYVVDAWRSIDHPAVLSDVNRAPHNLLSHLGLVAFPVFYTFFITAYFTCAVSASVLAKLDNQEASLLYGLRVVGRKFWRVTKFSTLSIFFFPLGVITQYKKLPRGVVGVVGSSFSLSMAQMAPVVISKNAGLVASINESVATLGKAWKESLVIRVSMFLSVLGLGLISFLPKLIQHYWFGGHTARFVGWIATALLSVGVFVMAKVLSTVLTTTLYYKAKHKEL